MKLRKLLTMTPQQAPHIEQRRVSLLQIPRRRRPPGVSPGLSKLARHQAEKCLRHDLHLEGPQHRFFRPGAALLHPQPLLMIAKAILLAESSSEDGHHLGRRQVVRAGDKIPRFSHNLRPKTHTLRPECRDRSPSNGIPAFGSETCAAGRRGTPDPGSKASSIDRAPGVPASDGPTLRGRPPRDDFRESTGAYRRASLRSRVTNGMGRPPEGGASSGPSTVLWA